MSFAPEKPVTLGRIAGLHGVRGWVKVQSYTDPPRAILGYRPWLLQSAEQWREVEVAERSAQGSRLRVRLRECDDRDAAAELVGREIAVPRSVLPASESGGWYWADLIGLQVINTAGTSFGRVSRLIETGANDVLVCAGADRERLVPFVEGTYVQAVDLESGVIRVDWDADF